MGLPVEVARPVAFLTVSRAGRIDRFSDCAVRAAPLDTTLSASRRRASSAGAPRPMRSSMTSLPTGLLRRILLPLVCAVAAFLVASAADAPVPTPVALAATCSDYASQAAAQRARDTRDADGDGLYCESLPCPCLSGSGDGPSAPPAPAPSPSP